MLTILANSWAESGKSVYVISIDGTQEDFFKLSESVHHIVLDVRGPSISLFKLNGLYMTIKRVLAIRGAIKKLSPDIVIAFMGVVNILTILATVKINTRVVISERNDPALQSLGFGWDRLRRYLYRYADLVSANTNAALKTMRDYVPEHKLVFVPNPMTDFEKQMGDAGDNKQLLAVGSLRYQKAYDVLLKACAVVFKEEPEWRLTIVGNGELWVELHALAEQLEINDKITWAGRVEPYTHYQNAQVFLLPSRHEGTPNVLLEAMTHGLPAIVTDASPGPLEYVKHEETGLVVPVEDPELLARAMLRLIGDECLRKRLGAKAVECVDNNRVVKALPKWEQVIGII